MDKCTTCPAEFSCSRLATALRIAEARRDLEDHPNLSRLVLRIKKTLADGDWDYPGSTKHCAFVNKNRDLHVLIEELIVALSDVPLDSSRRESEVCFDEA